MRNDEEARLAEEERRKAEEHKRAGLKVEEGIHLTLEAIQIEEEEEHTWIEAEDGARIFLKERLKSEEVLSKPAPLPQLSALPLQRGLPHLQRLAMHSTLPLSVLLQGIGIPPLLPSAVHPYSPLLC